MKTIRELGIKKKLYITIVLLFIAGVVAFSTLADTKREGPTGLTSFQLNGSELNLTWDYFPDATGYNIYRITADEFLKLDTVGQQTSFIDTTIKENMLYHYEITAIVNGEETFPSIPLSIRTTDFTDPLPVNIYSDLQGDYWVQLSWNATDDIDVHHYEIYRDGSKVGVVKSDPFVMYHDIGLSAATSYDYYVVTVDNTGRSAISNTIGITTTSSINEESTLENQLVEIEYSLPEEEQSIELEIPGEEEEQSIELEIPGEEVELENQEEINIEENNINEQIAEVNSAGFITISGVNIYSDNERVVYEEGFSNHKWTSDKDWLVFVNGKARWERNNEPEIDIAHADLKEEFAFYIAPEEINNTRLSFTWKKGTSHVGAGSIQELDVYIKPKGASWEGVDSIWFEDSIYENYTGNATINLPILDPGEYVISFAAMIATAEENENSLSWIEVDNVKIEIDFTKPIPPTLEAVYSYNVSSTEILWSHNQETSVIGYKVYRSTNSNDLNNFSLLGTTTSKDFIDPIAHPGENYYYFVTAVSDEGYESNPSNVQVVNRSENLPITSIPETPLNISVTSLSYTNVDLVWDEGDQTTTSYLIWMTQEGNLYEKVGETLNNSYRVEVIDGEEYSFRIMAIDGNGNYSAGSVPLSVVVPIRDIEPPTPPSNIRVLSKGGTFIEVGWDHSTDNVQVDRYEVQLQQQMESFQTVKTISGLNNQVVLTELTPGATYKMRVVAFDTSENFSISTEIEEATYSDITPPIVLLKRPYDGATGIGTSETILVRFDDHIDQSTVTTSTFIVREKSGQQVNGDFVFLNPNEIQFIHGGLKPNTEYEILIRPEIKNVSNLQFGQTMLSTFTTGSSQFVQPHGNYTNNTHLCKSCHNTHNGKAEGLLSSNSVNAVCFTCHNGLGSKYNTQKEFGTQNSQNVSIHPIYGPGGDEGTEVKCADCHKFHDAGIDLDTGNRLPAIGKLLTSTNNPPQHIKKTEVVNGKDYCWTCHGNIAGPFYSYGYSDDISKSGTNRLKQTTVRITGSITLNVGLYLTDHQTYYPLPTDMRNHNSPRMYELAGIDPRNAEYLGVQCLVCHERHGSEIKPLLRSDIGNLTPQQRANLNVNANTKDFCYQCHSNEKFTGSWTDNYFGYPNNEQSGHAQFDCQVCHNVHGTAYPKQLRLPYRQDTSRQTSGWSWNATTFTQSNALCFDCHDYSKLTQTATRMHGTSRSHWTGSGKQATCKHCHRPHGAIPEENVNSNINHRVGWPSPNVLGTSGRRSRWSSVPSSEIPRYERGSSGGSCYVHCHGRNHSGWRVSGATRASGDWALKTNWKTDSWLLNNRPEVYKINGTHFRDTSSGSGFTPFNGYHWK
ncbi:fibronectin type III domain-containing protein [Anaerobacillus isosaccharinicus]|uniref:Fibronectin type III domain-containing protein n=1 Tax=Anaerobacillus isosaccharinicus TaxID=1532552 RepID=A0A1S2LSE6_9BACI|nr:fibronectin type III domain-containing protein [Anaerobacillus isosaccharinicus]MBA5585439.1 fibronectin type III domain-containing protein [Anaerobacillus isosaccharinicus]QOY36243.1 fibronectin type III domain-containing protein [Anaerobacillus isosaccharinicus]